MVKYTECAYQIQRERHDECVKSHSNKKYDSKEEKEKDEAFDDLNKAKAKKEFHES